MTERPLSIVVVGSQNIDETVLKFIGVVGSGRGHQITRLPFTHEAHKFFEEGSAVDGVVVYHDLYDDNPVTLEIAGIAREFYPDIPIGVASSPEVDKVFSEKIRSLYGERVTTEPAEFQGLNQLFSEIERLARNPA